tara:strand:- start:197 stop:475 length:279 start_codon:yes stop_codon:yes gene_type:complete
LKKGRQFQEPNLLSHIFPVLATPKMRQSCRGNGVVALRASATFFLRPQKRHGQRKGNGVVALRTFAFWVEEEAAALKKISPKKREPKLSFFW